jgi:hypothetical protein
MAEWLSTAWAAEVEETVSSLPPVDGATGTVTLAIAVARKQELRLSWCYVDGAAGPVRAGEGSPDLSLTIAATDAADIFTGQVEPSVSFMRGRLKATGDGGLLIGFLASTAASGFADWRDGALALADPGSRPQISS